MTACICYSVGCVSTSLPVLLCSAGFGGGPGFGGVGTGGSFAFSTNKPTGGSLSAGTHILSSLHLDHVAQTIGSI